MIGKVTTACYKCWLSLPLSFADHKEQQTSHDDQGQARLKKLHVVGNSKLQISVPNVEGVCPC